VLSVSIAEDEVRGIGADNIVGQLVSWNYYQTTKTPANDKFVAAYKAKYGADRVTDDPIEAGYFGVYLWKLAVEKAKSTDVAAVKAAAKGIKFDAPEGTVTVDGDNQHTYKTVRIGKIRADGLIDEIWATKGPVKPDPYLCTYDWRGTLPSPAGGCPAMTATMAATH
jgi:urea transport system substrate-binding protein